MYIYYIPYISYIIVNRIEVSNFYSRHRQIYISFTGLIEYHRLIHRTSVRPLVWHTARTQVAGYRLVACLHLCTCRAIVLRIDPFWRWQSQCYLFLCCNTSPLLQYQNILIVQLFPLIMISHQYTDTHTDCVRLCAQQSFAVRSPDPTCY